MEKINMAEIEERVNSLRSQVGKRDGLTDQITYKCQKCKDEGGYLDRDGYGEVWKQCECFVQKRVERIFKSSHITEEFQKLGFQNFVTDGRPQLIKDAYDCAFSYLKNYQSIKDERNNSIALLGHPGCGKTHLLVAICNNLMKKGIEVFYFPWVEGFNEIKDNLSMLEERIRHMQDVEVLYIDDLLKGRKNPTDFQLEQLFAIVNHRYLNNKPILLSSEKDFDEISEIDEAIGTRLYQMAKKHTVILKTGDRSLNYRLVG